MTPRLRVAVAECRRRLRNGWEVFEDRGEVAWARMRGWTQEVEPMSEDEESVVDDVLKEEGTDG